MDTNKTDTITKSPTEIGEKKDEGGLLITNSKKHIKRLVQPALFVIFAEYLGRVSSIIEWAEDWCKGHEPDDLKKKIITVDSLCLYNLLKQDYTEDEIAEWFDAFYDVILSEYDNNLKRLDIEYDDD